MKIKKPIIAAFIGCSVIAGAAGAASLGSVAYQTSADAAVNMVTQGKVDIFLKEPDWVTDKDKIVPNDVFLKNPSVAATEEQVSPGYVYMQVLVPYGKITLANPDKTLYDRDANGNRLLKNHQLITFGCGEPEKDGEDRFLCGKHMTYNEDIASIDRSMGLKLNLNETLEGWTFLQVEDISMDKVPEEYRMDGEYRYLVYTYAYNSMLANPLEINDKYKDNPAVKKETIPLFEKIRVADVIEGLLDETDLLMPVRAFCIQGAHSSEASRDPDTNKIPNSAEGVIKEAASAFTVYANQNEDLSYAAILGSISD